MIHLKMINEKYLINTICLIEIQILLTVFDVLK